MEDFAALVAEVRRIAQRSRHRWTFVLSGSSDWSVRAVRIALDETQGSTLWLSDRALPVPAEPSRAAHRWLGRELDFLIYDAHGGFDPDAFGAAAGALRGGGLLFLLTPEWTHWPDLPDPQARRIAVFPQGPESLSQRFLERWISFLQDPGLLHIRQGQPLPPPPPCKTAPPLGDFGNCRTADQQAAVEQILRTARGRAHRPLILLSDRGRGKTAALGIAAGILLRTAPRRILVTGPRLYALHPLFQQVRCLLPSGTWENDHHVRYEGGELAFFPPDVLAQQPPPVELLFVDEAAALPAPLLEALLLRYPRIVFATTLHGYEGTGRGFEIRFRQTLEIQTPNYRQCWLRTPIRWAPEDPLEQFANRALLLNASPAPDAALRGRTPADCCFAWLDRDQLVRTESILSQVFGLLVVAHYQTRPLDLRHLLDGPNLGIACLRWQSYIAAVALVAREGAIGPALAQAIFRGERRVQGHLLPQTLCVHGGLERAPELRYGRVVRIAVHPALHRRGFGRRLLRELTRWAGHAQLDLLGASFGVTEDLLGFWESCGFLPVHLGTRKNAASGVQGVVVLQALGTEGRTLLREALAKFRQAFPILLAGPLRLLEPAIAARMLQATAPDAPPAIASEMRRALLAFARHHRPWEASLGTLHPFLCQQLGAALRVGRLDFPEASLLIALALQQRDWRETARTFHCSGRKALVQQLRQSVRKMLGEA